MKLINQKKIYLWCWQRSMLGKCPGIFRYRDGEPESRSNSVESAIFFGVKVDTCENMFVSSKKCFENIWAQYIFTKFWVAAGVDMNILCIGVGKRDVEAKQWKLWGPVHRTSTCSYCNALNHWKGECPLDTKANELLWYPVSFSYNDPLKIECLNVSVSDHKYLCAYLSLSLYIIWYMHMYTLYTQSTT